MDAKIFEIRDEFFKQAFLKALEVIDEERTGTETYHEKRYQYARRILAVDNSIMPSFEWLAQSREMKITDEVTAKALAVLEFTDDLFNKFSGVTANDKKV